MTQFDLLKGYINHGGQERYYNVYRQEKRSTEDLVNYVMGGDQDFLWFFKKFGEHDILNLKHEKILEIGSDSEDSAWLLKALGFDVTAIDLLPYSRALPLTYTRYQGDFLGTPDFFHETGPHGVFDTIYSISTIEHVGLTAYGEKEAKPDADIELAKKVFRLLEDDGRFFLSVPFGKTFVNFSNLWRVYDLDALTERLIPEGFITDSMDFFMSASGGDWPIGKILTREEAMSYDDPILPHVTAALVLRK